jgi:hypothetical protein
MGHYAWTIKKTGRKFAAKWIHVFTIKDGKVAALREFTDTAQFAAAFRGYCAIGPCARFQASRPPSTCSAARSPASCATCTAMAERSPKAQ